jgi:hypothetical protein
MPKNPKGRFVATNILIEFEDGSVSLRIPSGATLADVSENVEQAGKCHRGSPLSIDVHFNSGKDGRYGRALTYS